MYVYAAYRTFVHKHDDSLKPSRLDACIVSLYGRYTRHRNMLPEQTQYSNQSVSQVLNIMRGMRTTQGAHVGMGDIAVHGL